MKQQWWKLDQLVIDQRAAAALKRPPAAGALEAVVAKWHGQLESGARHSDEDCTPA